MELQNLLARYIEGAFSDEEAFIRRFAPEVSYPDACSLEECYMASEATRIEISNMNGHKFTKTISTTDFITWIDKNKEGSK